jgi:hypothetical protein
MIIGGLRLAVSTLAAAYPAPLVGVRLPKHVRYHCATPREAMIPAAIG